MSSASQSAPYEIYKFDEVALFDALANEWVDRAGVAEQRQARYLSGYLRHFNTKTILVEQNYVDRDYLDDYASFYAHSFPPYPRLTRRLHFFSDEFAASDLAEAFAGLNHDVEQRLIKSYVGFVVARPLPGAVIGRTILQTYEPESHRYYPVTREYHPYLFGIPLEIRQSLAFQQQDTVVAACATVALWSAFHKTQRLFESPRPSPSKITRSANLVRGSMRAMPSRSLTVEQIGQAILSAGLEPEYTEIHADTPLSSLLYGYVCMGIPVILLVHIRGVGNHAMTVVGYSEKKGFAHACEPETQISYRARCIDRWYVHDDNIGPFAFVRIADKPSDFAEDETEAREAFHDAPYALEVVWHDGERREHTVQCAPMFAIAPVHHLIRMTFLGLQVWLGMLKAIFQEYDRALGIDCAQLEWDVRLQLSNDVKRELRDRAGENTAIAGMLLKPYPLYVWRCTVRYAEATLIEITADATEVEKAFPFIDILFLNPQIGREIQRIFEIAGVREQWRDALGTRVVDFVSSGA